MRPPCASARSCSVYRSVCPSEYNHTSREGLSCLPSLYPVMPFLLLSSITYSCICLPWRTPSNQSSSFLSSFIICLFLDTYFKLALPTFHSPLLLGAPSPCSLPTSPLYWKETITVSDSHMWCGGHGGEVRGVLQWWVCESVFTVWSSVCVHRCSLDLCMFSSCVRIEAVQRDHPHSTMVVGSGFCVMWRTR